MITCWPRCPGWSSTWSAAKRVDWSSVGRLSGLDLQTMKRWIWGIWGGMLTMIMIKTKQELLRKLHRTVWRHPWESFHWGIQIDECGEKLSTMSTMFTPELKNGECQTRKAWFHKLTLLRLYNVHQDRKCFLYQNGDYELDWSSYKLLFSNFLLGRTIYGPGQLRSLQFFFLVSSPSPPSRASGLGRLSRVLHKVNVDQFLLLRQIRLWLLRQQRHDWEVQDRLQRLRTQMLPSTMQEYQKHNATATRLNARLLWKSQSAVLVTNKCKMPTRSV